MALTKAIVYGKERRSPYRGAKSFDGSCRNHGTCAYCRRNRLYRSRRQEEQARQEVIDSCEGVPQEVTRLLSSFFPRANPHSTVMLRWFAAMQDKVSD